MNPFSNPNSVNDVDKLPPDVYSNGNNVIDALGDYVKKFFLPSDNVVDNAHFGDICTMLKLTLDILSKINIELDNLTVHMFIDQVIKGVKKNPILVGLAGTLLTVDMVNTYTLTSPQQQSITYAVIFCGFLEGITLAYYHSQTTDFIMNVSSLFEQQRSQINLLDYLSPFVFAKLKSVRSEVLFLMKTPYDPHDSGLLLQLNIFEAMCEDTVSFRDDNAAAGFELYSHRVDQPPNPATGDKYTTYDYDTHNTLFFTAFTKAWSNLYQSWNLLFMHTDFRNVLGWAKLLCPAVCAMYQDVDGIYINNRLFALYVYLQVFLMRRVSRINEVEIFSEDLSRAWASLNLKAAQAYKQLVENVIVTECSDYVQFVYKSNQDVAQQTWAHVKSSILLSRNIVDSNSDNGDRKSGELCFGRNSACEDGACALYDTEYRCCKNTVLGLNGNWLPDFYCKDLKAGDSCFLDRQCQSGTCKNGQCKGLQACNSDSECHMTASGCRGDANKGVSDDNCHAIVGSGTEMCTCDNPTPLAPQCTVDTDCGSALGRSYSRNPDLGSHNCRVLGNGESYCATPKYQCTSDKDCHTRWSGSTYSDTGAGYKCEWHVSGAACSRALPPDVVPYATNTPSNYPGYPGARACVFNQDCDGACGQCSAGKSCVNRVCI